MESIEQLKQDNVKLQERLNNAAKFFREQKAQIEALTNEVKEKTSLAMDYRNQIETLTKENEELKRTPKEEVIDTEKWNALVTEKENLNKQCNEYELKLQKLENNIDSKDKAYEVLQNTYNEVYAEKEKLTKQFKEQEKFESEVINTKVTELETKLKNSEAAYEELRKKYSELKELHDGDLKRYNELEDNYEGLQNKFKENDIVKGEAELKAENLQIEYTKKFEEQNIQIKSLNKQIEESKEASNDVLKKFEELRESNNMLQNSSAKIANELQSYKIKYNEEHMLYDDLKKNNNIIKNELEEAKGNREEFRSQLVDLEKKYDQLNKLYEDCESEKLAALSDCKQLQEKINYIEANNISDKEWQDHLEYVIEQIRNLVDDVVNPKTVTNEIKENVMKRTGDYNVSGENIGV